MIGRLRGKLLEKEASGLVVDAGGVGYTVSVPLSTFSRLEGDDVDLYIHTEVRSDAIRLFGFLSREEREVFRLLTNVQGVGPTTALAVLSGLSLQDLLEAVAVGDTRRLTGIPRVGKKTAERVCLELRGKLDAIEVPSDRRAASPEAMPIELADALGALQNLGYKPQQAKQALLAARAEAPDGPLETWLRLALRTLSR